LAVGTPGGGQDTPGRESLICPLPGVACGFYWGISRIQRSDADVNANEETRIGNTPLRDVADECSLAVATLLIGGADRAAGVVLNDGSA